MRYESLFFCLIISVISTVAPIQAAVSFVREQSFSVPGVESIDQLKLIPTGPGSSLVALVTSGRVITSFSVGLDSTFFRDTTGGKYLFGPVELADVNRDSVADIVVIRQFNLDSLGFGDTARIWLDVYDSAQARRKDSVLFLSGPGIPMGGSYSAGPLLRAVDLDGDGYNELVVSVQIVSVGGDINFGSGFTSGETYVYRRVPDSLLVDQGYFSTHFYDLGQISSTRAFAVTVGQEDDTWGMGTDWFQGREALRSFSSAGVGNLLVADTAPTDRCTGAIILYGGVGNISSATPGPCLLTRADASWSNCVEYPPPPVQYSSRLELYFLLSNDSTRLLWSKDITGTKYNNFMYHPQLPGVFFGFSGDTLLMFSGSDGSIRDRLTDVPTGQRHWDYPYNDSIPRLVVINGTTVSLYHLDIATSVDDDPGNAALPRSFTLGNPYPNPFNPSTLIPVATGPGGELTLEVYNITGQRVATLFEGKTSANQNLSIRWDTKSVASGIYFARAVLNNVTETRKLMLLK